jgi:CRP-like cAMP-binding protein
MELGRPYSKLLSRLERFGPLMPDDRQLITSLPLKVVNVPAGFEIVSCGETASKCSLLLDGFLYSHKVVTGPRRQITSFYVPGELADLMTLYLPRADHSLTTLGSAVLAFVPHEALREVLDQSSTLAQALLRESLIQAGIFQQWLVNLGTRDASGRLAHIICELTVRLQAVGQARDFSFSMPWTQTDVADACGISSVHANRVIQDFRRGGLVEWESRRVKIRDWDALVGVAGFDDEYLQCRAAPANDAQLPRFPKAFGSDASFVQHERSS